MCAPETYYCDVGTPVGSTRNCEFFDNHPTRMNLAPGDRCLSNSDCFSGRCDTEVGVNICIGFERNQACTDDRQCNAGLFWYRAEGATNGHCQTVSYLGERCSGSQRCAFGHLCANNTCVALGSLPEGTLFNVTDNEAFPFPAADSRTMYWACEHFWAAMTNIVSEGGTNFLFECMRGPEKQFDSYERQDAREPCKYETTNKAGTWCFYLETY